MASMEKIKRTAQSAAYAATEKAQSAAAFAGEKAGELKGYTEKKAALAREKRSLAKSYQALGEWYAAKCIDDAPEAVADIVRAIRASQEKIASLRK